MSARGRSDPAFFAKRQAKQKHPSSGLGRGASRTYISPRVHRLIKRPILDHDRAGLGLPAGGVDEQHGLALLDVASVAVRFLLGEAQGEEGAREGAAAGADQTAAQGAEQGVTGNDREGAGNEDGADEPKGRAETAP